VVDTAPDVLGFGLVFQTLETPNPGPEFLVFLVLGLLSD
jgi:hypothetical protein